MQHKTVGRCILVLKMTDAAKMTLDLDQYIEFSSVKSTIVYDTYRLIIAYVHYCCRSAMEEAPQQDRSMLKAAMVNPKSFRVLTSYCQA